MCTEESAVIEMKLEDCSVILAFSEDPVDGVMERIRSILKHVYEERVQNDLKEMVKSPSSN